MSNDHDPTILELQAFVTGVPKYCNGMTFTIAGNTYTAVQAVSLATTLLDAALAKSQAKAAYLAAVAAERTLDTTAGQTVRELRQNLTLMFSNAPLTMDALQISVRKKPKALSTEALAAKAAKAEATRKARGTASKKQKATLSGNVSGVTITPVVEPGTASPTPTSTPSPMAIPAVVPGAVSSGH